MTYQEQLKAKAAVVRQARALLDSMHPSRETATYELAIALGAFAQVVESEDMADWANPLDVMREALQRVLSTTEGHAKLARRKWNERARANAQKGAR